MEETVTLAAALGRVGAEDQEALRILCAQAERELRGRLSEDAGDCGGAFTLAAAWLALAGLCAGSAAGGVESFTAGGLTIRKGTAGDRLLRAESLRRQAEEAVRPYLKDEGFSFLGVEG